MALAECPFQVPVPVDVRYPGTVGSVMPPLIPVLRRLWVVPFELLTSKRPSTWSEWFSFSKWGT